MRFQTLRPKASWPKTTVLPVADFADRVQLAPVAFSQAATDGRLEGSLLLCIHVRFYVEQQEVDLHPVRQVRGLVSGSDGSIPFSSTSFNPAALLRLNANRRISPEAQVARCVASFGPSR